jgi:hypothetical protein
VQWADKNLYNKTLKKQASLFQKNADMLITWLAMTLNLWRRSLQLDPSSQTIYNFQCIREFSSQRVQAGLFEVFEQAPSFVPIPIHTIACSKRMM